MKCWEIEKARADKLEQEIKALQERDAGHDVELQRQRDLTQSIREALEDSQNMIRNMRAKQCEVRQLLNQALTNLNGQ